MVDQQEYNFSDNLDTDHGGGRVFVTGKFLKIFSYTGQ
jgi:hypothetical protein